MIARQWIGETRESDADVYGTYLNTFGKVLTKGGGVGGGERNLQLSLRFYF